MDPTSVADLRQEISAHVERRLDTKTQDGLVLDVAIVGAGISGLYTGWRLAGPGSLANKNAHVFEMDERIGGRLHSVILPGMQVVGELGGMRYMPAQKIVATLIERVFCDELVGIPFQMGDTATHFCYMRTQRFRTNAWVEAQNRGRKFITNYFLAKEHVGYSPDQLFNKVVYDVLVADPWFTNGPFSRKVGHTPPYDYHFELKAEDWDQIKPQLTYRFSGPYHKMLLNNLGFWNVIKDQVGQEGYEFLSAAGGYYSNTINWNAAEAFPYMIGDFSDASTEYRTIRGGYDLIAYAIAAAYLDQPGTKIWSKNRLVGFRRSRPGEPRRYCLRFYHAPSSTTSSSDWRVYADSIVLAMPRRSLELLEQEDNGAAFFFGPPGPNSLIKKRIESVDHQPSFKLLMGFEYPWWEEDFGATAGASITDLPMRQCYYFGTDPHDSHSLFLASYNDMRTVDFWKALELGDRERFQFRATRLASLATFQSLAAQGAPRAMVEEAMKEVRALHGPQSAPIPDPYIACYKDWSDDPFGGGYHAWRPGVKVWEVMPYMRQPCSNEQIHICGEAYSDQQGWVEGALCVAERMLQRHFGLAWPSWLDTTYYLGW